MNNEARIQMLNPENSSEYTTDAILRGAQYPDRATGLLKEVSCCSVKRPAMMNE